MCIGSQYFLQFQLEYLQKPKRQSRFSFDTLYPQSISHNVQLNAVLQYSPYVFRYCIECIRCSVKNPIFTASMALPFHISSCDKPNSFELPCNTHSLPFHTYNKRSSPISQNYFESLSIKAKCASIGISPIVKQFLVLINLIIKYAQF